MDKQRNSTSYLTTVNHKTKSGQTVINNLREFVKTNNALLKEASDMSVFKEPMRIKLAGRLGKTKRYSDVDPIWNNVKLEEADKVDVYLYSRA
jgi:hypothetical protein